MAYLLALLSQKTVERISDGLLLLSGLTLAGGLALVFIADRLTSTRNRRR